MFERSVVHAHAARRARFHEHVGIATAHCIYPIEIRGTVGGKAFIGKTHVLVVVHLYILRAVIFHHATDRFGKIVYHFFRAEIQKVSTHYGNALAPSVQKAVFIVVRKHFFTLHANDLRLYP